MMTTGDRKYLLPVLALLLIILGALALRLWASNRSLMIEGPANARLGPDGLVYIVTDTALYVYDQDGGLDDYIPLTGR